MDELRRFVDYTINQFKDHFPMNGNNINEQTMISIMRYHLSKLCLILAGKLRFKSFYREKKLSQGLNRLKTLGSFTQNGTKSIID